MSDFMVMTWKKAFILVTLAMAVSWGVFAYIYIPPIFLYTPEGRYRIAMAGRSVMGQWFRYWNWPVPFRKYALRFGLPIPHRHYVKDGFFLDYVQISPPSEDAGQSGFGSRTIESLRVQVSARSHDALFFKFCFVDFGDRTIKDQVDRDAHVERLKQLTRRVHDFTREQGIRLILGNALPVLDRDAGGQWVRKEYNRWLLEYSKSNPDIVFFDFFGPLTGKSDTLNRNYAISPINSHLSTEAYQLLDNRYSETLRGLNR